MASRVSDADGQVSANQCQLEATNQYNAAPPSALNADIMDSGAHSLSIKILLKPRKAPILNGLKTRSLSASGHHKRRAKVLLTHTRVCSVA